MNQKTSPVSALKENKPQTKHKPQHRTGGERELWVRDREPGVKWNLYF